MPKTDTIKIYELMLSHHDFTVEIRWLYSNIRLAGRDDLWLIDAASYMLSAGTFARMGYDGSEWNWTSTIDAIRRRVLGEAEHV